MTNETDYQHDNALRAEFAAPRVRKFSPHQAAAITRAANARRRAVRKAAALAAGLPWKD